MFGYVMKNALGIGAGLMVLVAAAIVFAWPVAAQSAPPKPENLRVIDKTHRSVTLGWDDPGDASIVGYRILRRQIPIMASGYFKEIESNTNSTSTEYTDTEDYLEPNIRYVYRIQSVSASGDLSGQSNYVRVRVPRWQAPQNLSAEVVEQADGSYDIELDWDDEPPVNYQAFVVGWRISRRMTAPWVEEEFTELIDRRGVWGGGYTDSGVNWPREYEYKVEAKTLNGSYGLPGTVAVGEVGSLSEPIVTPEHIAYTWWYWWGNNYFEEIEIEFTIHTESMDMPGRNGIYLMLCQGGLAGNAFYFGMQFDDSGERAIFSRWGERDLALARVDPNEGWIESSDHEGDFIGVRRHFDWKPGNYVARLAPDDEVAEGEWYGLWITDVDTDVTTWIGSLWFPAAVIDDTAYSTVEIYGNPGIRPMDIAEVHVTISRPRGDSVAATSASTGYTIIHGGNIPNSEIRGTASGVDIWVGGDTARTTAPTRLQFGR